NTARQGLLIAFTDESGRSERLHARGMPTGGFYPGEKRLRWPRATSPTWRELAERCKPHVRSDRPEHQQARGYPRLPDGSGVATPCLGEIGGVYTGDVDAGTAVDQQETHASHGREHGLGRHCRFDREPRTEIVLGSG